MNFAMTSAKEKFFTMSKQKARMMGFALLFSFAALRAMAGEVTHSPSLMPQAVELSDPSN
jgi:hypothetical protein